MANETCNDLGSTVSGAVNGIVETAGKLAQQQVELLGSGVNAVVQIIEPLAKTAIDLLGSASNTLGQVLQNVSSAIAPKK